MENGNGNLVVGESMRTRQEAGNSVQLCSIPGIVTPFDERILYPLLVNFKYASHLVEIGEFVFACSPGAVTWAKNVYLCEGLSFPSPLTSWIPGRPSSTWLSGVLGVGSNSVTQRNVDHEVDSRRRQRKKGFPASTLPPSFPI